MFEFHDATKEGDGKRLHDLYRYLLLLYKANHKTKYAYASLLYLVKIEVIFFNKHGSRAGNIPLDLGMEQLNKIVKTMWRSLGANINEESAA